MKWLFSSILLVLVSATVFADVDPASIRMRTYNAVVPCAAQMAGVQPSRVDIDRSTYDYFGETPTIYDNCIVPRLRQAGLTAPKISLADFATNLAKTDLGEFINEVAIRIINQ